MGVIAWKYYFQAMTPMRRGANNWRFLSWASEVFWEEVEVTIILGIPKCSGYVGSNSIRIECVRMSRGPPLGPGPKEKTRHVHARVRVCSCSCSKQTSVPHDQCTGFRTWSGKNSTRSRQNRTRSRTRKRSGHGPSTVYKHYICENNYKINIYILAKRTSWVHAFYLHV